MLSGLTTQLTHHHIIKKCDRGPNSVENGAVLNRKIHDGVHSLEHTNKELYNEINECLRLYKICAEENKTDCLEVWKDVEKAAKRELIKK